MSTDRDTQTHENGETATDGESLAELNDRVELLEEQLMSEKQERERLERNMKRLQALTEALRKQIRQETDADLSAGSGWFK